MARDLEAVKDYMRFEDLAEGLDESEAVRQEALIQGLMAAAARYLDNGGIPEPEGEDELYDLCVKGLVLHWYDHRDDVGGETPVPQGLRPVITQLKLVAAAKRAAMSG